MPGEVVLRLERRRHRRADTLRQTEQRGAGVALDGSEAGEYEQAASVRGDTQGGVERVRVGSDCLRLPCPVGDRRVGDKGLDLPPERLEGERPGALAPPAWSCPQARAALLGLGWLAQANPGAVSSIPRLLPR